MTTHVSAAQAAEIDAKLMGPEYGFTLEQLMELAGLSVAAATERPASSMSCSSVNPYSGPMSFASISAACAALTCVVMETPPASPAAEEPILLREMAGPRAKPAAPSGSPERCATATPRARRLARGAEPRARRKSADLADAHVARMPSPGRVFVSFDGRGRGSRNVRVGFREKSDAVGRHGFSGLGRTLLFGRIRPIDTPSRT